MFSPTINCSWYLHLNESTIIDTIMESINSLRNCTGPIMKSHKYSPVNFGSPLPPHNTLETLWLLNRQMYVIIASTTLCQHSHTESGMSPAQQKSTWKHCKVVTLVQHVLAWFETHDQVNDYYRFGHQPVSFFNVELSVSYSAANSLKVQCHATILSQSTL